MQMGGVYLYPTSKKEKWIQFEIMVNGGVCDSVSVAIRVWLPWATWITTQRSFKGIYCHVRSGYNCTSHLLETSIWLAFCVDVVFPAPALSRIVVLPGAVQLPHSSPAKPLQIRSFDVAPFCPSSIICLSYLMYAVPGLQRFRLHVMYLHFSKIFWSSPLRLNSSLLVIIVMPRKPTNVWYVLKMGSVHIRVVTLVEAHLIVWESRSRGGQNLVGLKIFNGLGVVGVGAKFPFCSFLGGFMRLSPWPLWWIRRNRQKLSKNAQTRVTRSKCPQLRNWKIHSDSSTPTLQVWVKSGLLLSGSA